MWTVHIHILICCRFFCCFIRIAQPIQNRSDHKTFYSPVISVLLHCHFLFSFSVCVEWEKPNILRVSCFFLSLDTKVKLFWGKRLQSKPYTCFIFVVIKIRMLLQIERPMFKRKHFRKKWPYFPFEFNLSFIIIIVECCVFLFLICFTLPKYCPGSCIVFLYRKDNQQKNRTRNSKQIDKIKLLELFHRLYSSICMDMKFILEFSHAPDTILTKLSVHISVTFGNSNKGTGDK